MRRILVTLMALALTAWAAPVLIASPADAAAPVNPCHGYVYSFKKDGGTIRMEYWIYCTRRVDRIGLKAFIREGDRYSQKNRVTCRNAYVCKSVETLRDRAGKQYYGARAAEGFNPPSSYVQDNSHVWICNGQGASAMRCGGASARF